MDKVVNIDFQDSLSYHDDFSQEVCIQQNQGQKLAPILITKEDVQLYVDSFKSPKNEEVQERKDLPSFLPEIPKLFLSPKAKPQSLPSSNHEITQDDVQIYVNSFKSPTVKTFKNSAVVMNKQEVVKEEEKNSSNKDESYESFQTIDYEPVGQPISNRNNI